MDFEWKAFHCELLSQRKQGDLFTLLHNVSMSDLPLALRTRQSIPYSVASPQDSFENLYRYLGPALNKSGQQQTRYPHVDRSAITDRNCPVIDLDFSMIAPHVSHSLSASNNHPKHLIAQFPITPKDCHETGALRIAPSPLRARLSSREAIKDSTD